MDLGVRMDDSALDRKEAAKHGRIPPDGSGAAAHPSHVSLEGVHSSVEVPRYQAGFWEQWRAFVGPAVLVSVGYMDPGNWGTDLQGGAQFKYGLLWVVGLASLMAIFMQVISARLGVVTGKDLAQCCRDWYPKWSRWPNWLMSEVAIGACDLAEVLGSAVALNLMFHIPLLWAVIITGLDVLLLLALQWFGMRTIEAVVLLLIATIGVCYFIEIFVVSADSDWIRVAYLTLAPLLGTAVASTLFAVALLASGQSSTITGTLAGQVVMEGFMHWRIRPWVRRLITRTLAIIPAVLIIGIRGDSSV